LKGELVEEGVVAEIMVKVTVRGQQMEGTKMVLPDIVDQGSTLLGIIGTTVNDDALAGELVGHDITVFL
jgi:hypothetical protein